MSRAGRPSRTNLDALREQARALPREPGVYLFRDAAGEVLYVGKAKSLRARVASYFGAEASRSVKLVRLVREIDSIETFPVRSEAEALLLEWNLIREFGPRFNIQLRDDKSYPYIKITVTEPFPRIFVTRRLDDDGSRYLGPFTDVGAMRRALRTIKKMYTVRSCHYRMPEELPPRPCLDYHIGRCKAPCAGLQSEADYRGMIDEILEILGGRTGVVRRSVEQRMAEAADAMEYERAAESRDVLRGLDQLESRQAAIDPRGGSHDVIGFAREDEGGSVCGIVLRVREGRLVGRRIHYLGNVGEEADDAVLGALVKGFYLRHADDVPSELLVPEPFEEQDLVEEYLSGLADRRFRVRVPVRGPKRELTRAANRNAAHVLARDRSEREEEPAADRGAGGVPPAAARLGEALELGQPAREIVCFDVSTLAGRESVGSCVWLSDGRPHKDEYRRFRIRESEDGKPDDYAMMQEIVSRYFDRRVREGHPLPDLVVVDGGRGQLSAARQAMDAAGVSDLPTVALAKREEEVFRPESALPLRLPRTDPGLHWLQRARDEAHRFALQYNRTLRRRRALRSRLGEIPGVGPAREQLLLERFGSLDIIRRATVAQLTRTPGIGRATAASILSSLRPDETEPGYKSGDASGSTSDSGSGEGSRAGPF
ncbi:excinuclease ABC subunit UvrC [Candidatus Palauibacter sp.]|uniref:excinuclease ABC subunit UvrC n=1 Tax=Candidatus Palauibacter sp. TaxID=3101350 RepID=UPI003B024760